MSIISYTKSRLAFSPYFYFARHDSFLSETDLDSLGFFYFLFIGYASANILLLIMYEKNDSQFALLYLHHTLTLALLLFSWIIGFAPTGVVVFYIHLVSDIPLDFTKCFYYLHYDSDHLRVPLSELGFVSTLLAWLYYRLYVFPYHIIYPPTFYFHGYFVPPDPLFVKFYWGLATGLVTLFVFHLWWYYKMLGIAYKLVRSDENIQSAGRDDLHEKQN